jgi:hypothetical protein
MFRERKYRRLHSTRTGSRQCLEGNAYCIGNGPSRKGFDLNKLKASGQTYGCNALYRDFIPDFIFSVDTKITVKMVKDEVG